MNIFVAGATGAGRSLVPLLVAAAAVNFGLACIGEQVRSDGITPDDAARPATRQPGPVPEAVPLAKPKSLDQIGLP
ncbi:MAG TPA: hypothetical protein VHT48_04710, partial [Methylocella sp.]|nr:hypothetical protein [Methylocella sp.]